MDGNLLRLTAELEACHARANDPRPQGNDAALDAALDDYWAVADQIEGIPARTPEGVAAKARVLRSVIDMVGRDDGALGKHTHSLLRDILGEGVRPEPDSQASRGLDGPFVAACTRYTHLESEYARLCRATDWPSERVRAPADRALEAEFRAVGAEQRKLVEWLTVTAPRTQEGLRAKAAAALLYVDGDGVTPNLALSALEDVVGRASARSALQDRLVGLTLTRWQKRFGHSLGMTQQQAARIEALAGLIDLLDLLDGDCDLEPEFAGCEAGDDDVSPVLLAMGFPGDFAIFDDEAEPNGDKQDTSQGEDEYHH